MPCRLYFDGLCEPTNPGGIAVYAWIYKGKMNTTDDKGSGEVCRGARATNNLAEYYALGWGLRAVLERHLKEIQELESPLLIVSGDSQLVIKQMLGEYQVRSVKLTPVWQRCCKLVKAIEGKGITVVFVWIKREMNIQADILGRVQYRLLRGKKS